MDYADSTNDWRSPDVPVKNLWRDTAPQSCATIPLPLALCNNVGGCPHWQGMTNVSLVIKGLDEAFAATVKGAHQPTDRSTVPRAFSSVLPLCAISISPIASSSLSLSPSSSGDICSRSRRHFVQIVSDRWRDDRARAELRGGRVHKSQWEMDRSQPRRKESPQRDREIVKSLPPLWGRGKRD